MSGIIIDKRLNRSNQSSSDKERFKKRKKEHIKAAINKLIDDGCINDAINKRPVKIIINDELDTIQTTKDNFKKVFIGNKKYRKGDQIPKNRNDESGSKAGNEKGKFELELSFEEVEEFIFNELELPYLTKKELGLITEKQSKNSGYQKVGLPSNLSVIRSFKNSLARKFALEGYYDEEIKKLEAQYEKPDDGENVHPYSDELYRQVLLLKKLKESISYLEDLDLRYRHRENVDVPVIQGVLFCLMDVSGSMDKDRKEIAKTLFLLLYFFIKNKYEKFEVVFIKHTTEAIRCNEEEFFKSNISGGTSFLSGYKVITDEIILNYPSNKYNIYIAQASDGDNCSIEEEECASMIELLFNKINLFVFLGCKIDINNCSNLVKCFKEISLSPGEIPIKYIDVKDKKDCLSSFISIFKRKTYETH